MTNNPQSPLAQFEDDGGPAPEEQPIYNVFVYGTLKGMHNGFTRGRGTIAFVGHGKTAEKYVLFNGGFPCVRKATEENADSVAHIIGELHQVDTDAIEALDRYEGHPTFFTREEVAVEVGGERVVAWLYFGPEGTEGHRPIIPPREDGTATWPVEAL